MVQVSKWLVISLILTVVFLTIVIVYDDSVMMNQRAMLRSMMSNPSCMLDQLQYQRNLNKMKVHANEPGKLSTGRED